jgi:hypothetical protein
MIFIDDLLIKFGIELIGGEGGTGVIDGVTGGEVLGYFLFFVSVVLVYVVNVGEMLLFFVLELTVVDLLFVGFLELMVGFEDLVFGFVINIDVDDLFTLFYGLVGLF